MSLSDHTISDIFGFAGVIASTCITQFFIYRASVRRADVTDRKVETLQATATDNNKGIAVMQALVAPATVTKEGC